MPIGKSRGWTSDFQSNRFLGVSEGASTAPSE